jgi:hypothetical protein
MTSQVREASMSEEMERAVAFVRDYPKTKRVLVTRPAYQDITSMGTPYTEPESQFWTDRPTTFADCANDLRKALSTHPDKGGS